MSVCSVKYESSSEPGKAKLYVYQPIAVMVEFIRFTIVEKIKIKYKRVTIIGANWSFELENRPYDRRLMKRNQNRPATL
jgi:hypothetical protein